MEHSPQERLPSRFGFGTPLPLDSINLSFLLPPRGEFSDPQWYLIKAWSGLLERVSEGDGV